MTATIELSSAKQKLQSVLGESQSVYFNHLKNWFRKRISKENFDIEARKLLPKEHSHLHNAFLLAILNKCQTLASFTPNTANNNTNMANNTSMTSPPANLLPIAPSHLVVQPKPEIALTGNDRLMKGKINRKKNNKNNNNKVDQTFRPVHHLEENNNDGDDEEDGIDDKVMDEERKLRYCYKEPVLPDNSLLHGRMLVMAWEEGLEGVDEQSVEVMVKAVESLLKKLITALVSKRSGFRVRDDKFVFSHGSKLPNPWLLNAQSRYRGAKVEEVAESVDIGAQVVGSGGDLDAFVPVGRPTLRDVEQQTAFEVACSAPETVSEWQRRPIDLYDLFALLQERKSLIPCHSVYSINLHRVISRLQHFGHDE